MTIPEQVSAFTAPGRRRWFLVALALPALAPVATSGAAVVGACRTASGPAVFPRHLPVLAVTISAEHDSYRRGETALLPVQVSVGLPGGVKAPMAQVKVSGLKTMAVQTDQSGGDDRARRQLTTSTPACGAPVAFVADTGGWA
jgi:hypothetical protein